MNSINVVITIMNMNNEQLWTLKNNEKDIHVRKIDDFQCIDETKWNDAVIANLILTSCFPSIILFMQPKTILSPCNDSIFLRWKCNRILEIGNGPFLFSPYLSPLFFMNLNRFITFTFGLFKANLAKDFIQFTFMVTSQKRFHVLFSHK